MTQMASPLNRGSCPAGTDEVYHRFLLKFAFVHKLFTRSKNVRLAPSPFLV